MKALDTETVRRLRGEILELVYEGHHAQRSRLTDLILWGVLKRLQYDVSQNDVLTTLQDLSDRKYLSFTEDRNERTGVVRITQIQITPSGRDLVEGTKSDLAVHVIV